MYVGRAVETLFDVVDRRRNRTTCDIICVYVYDRIGDIHENFIK